MTDSRRVHERFECELDVVVSLHGREIRGKTKNVSLGGLLITIGESIPIGTEVKLRIRFPALKEDADLPVTVRWASKEQLGVQFGSLRALEVWAINQLMRGS